MSSEAFDYSRDAFALAEELDRLPSPDEVAGALFRYLAPLGTSGLCLSFLPGLGQPLENAVLASRWPDELLKIYCQERYVDVDPFARRLRRTSRPFRWRDVTSDRERDPRVHALMALRRDFGFADGLVIPIHAPRGRTGFVSISGRRLCIPNRIKPAIHLVAFYAFHRARNLRTRDEKAEIGLTARECEVLSWTAVGKSAWEIGKILHIAKRTVDEHIQTAFHKLQAVNKTQAVAIALLEGLIRI